MFFSIFDQRSLGKPCGLDKGVETVEQQQQRVVHPRIFNMVVLLFSLLSHSGLSDRGGDLGVFNRHDSDPGQV